jgi:hypothetical protein
MEAIRQVNKVKGISRLVMITILITIVVFGSLIVFVVVNWLSTRHRTITFAQTGLDSTAIGIVVVVNGAAKNYSDLPYSIELNEGDVVSYLFSNLILSSTANKRFDLLNVTGSTSSITVITSETITGNYGVQWLLTFAQTGLDSSTIGTVVTIDSVEKMYADLPFSEWVNNGEIASFAYASSVSSSTTGKLFRLSNVTGSFSPINVTNAQTITGNYVLKSVVWLVGLSTSGLKMMAGNDLTFMAAEFLEKIPATYKYSFAVDGNTLYIGLTYGGAKVYRVNLKTGNLNTLTISDTGDLRDLKTSGGSLYALVMDYSSGNSFLTKINLNTFTVTETLALTSFVKGTPYEMQLTANAAYIVTYNSSSGASGLAYVSLPDLRDYFSVQVSISASTKVDTDGERVYVRGSDEVAVYSCNPPLTFVGKISGILGYGDLLCANGKIYVAGSTLDWKPAVYVIKTETMTVEQTLLLSTGSGAALNLAVNDSTVYVLFFSSGEGCSLGTIESGSTKFLIPNTANEFPTSLFYVEW